MTSGAMYDDLIESLRGEFVDEAEDNLNIIDLAMEGLHSGKETGASALNKIRRAAHSLKGSSSVADFPLVTVIMHRLEDYLSSLKELTTDYIDDIQIYSDKARKFSSINVDQKAISSADLVRELPARRITGIVEKPIISKTKRKIEVMLVIKEKTAGLIFERELRSSGLRVNTINNSFNAIEMAVRTQPDLIIVSGVVDVLGGVDVLCAIHAMSVTKNIPICLLTSFEKNHPDLKGLPKDTNLIQKSNLQQDLKDVLSKLGF